MDIKCLNTKLGQDHLAKELDCSSSTLQRYRQCIDMLTIQNSSNSHKRKQKSSNDLKRPQQTSNEHSPMVELWSKLLHMLSPLKLK